MGSMERAPEPTMEEILASIRRIISDDEVKSAESPPASSPEAKAAEVDADADTKIIDDIARVLSGGTPADSASEDDDILDLTKELSELQAVADETAALPELAYPAQAAETMILAETEIAEPDARADPEPVIAMPPPPAEEPSALDLAIAELRAREQARMAQAEQTYAREPEPVFETHPAPDFAAAPEAFDDDEPELVLTESETETVTETLYEPEFVEDLAASPAPEAEMPSWLQSVGSSPQPEPVKAPEPESASTQINGNGSHGMRTTHYSEFGINANRSLEDSVKEMLRPLLREWLDEHMSRVLEAALRDELKDAEERWQRNEQRRRPY
jgi:cell pole-organizing protein PopZ